MITVEDSNSQRERRICIVGAGAAGMAAAWSLSRTKNFAVTVYEAADHVGGVATSISLPGSKNPSWINNRVQGGSPGFFNTKQFFSEFGCSFEHINLRIAVGNDEFAWNNEVATPFIKRMGAEISRFRSVLSTVHKLPFLFLFVPIGRLLKLRGFSEDFIQHVIQPLMALFFAAGADALKVPATAVAQLVFDEDAKMFDFTGDTLLSKEPKMAVFPQLASVYDKVAIASGARIRLGTRVTSITRAADHVTIVDDTGASADFDEVVLACPAHVALSILKKPTALERLVLGRVKRVPAKIVIHTDQEFVRRHYAVTGDLSAQYYVRRSRGGARSQLEMTYHMNRYQVQLKDFERDLFYTIDPIDEVDAGCIVENLEVDGTSHSCRHFTSIVPLWRFIQGRRRTWYCGGDTLFNIHEMALVSGFAVAKRLGAPYPYSNDSRARKVFDMYFGLIHS